MNTWKRQNQSDRRAAHAVQRGGGFTAERAREVGVAWAEAEARDTVPVGEWPFAVSDALPLVPLTRNPKTRRNMAALVLAAAARQWRELAGETLSLAA